MLQLLYRFALFSLLIAIATTASTAGAQQATLGTGTGGGDDRSTGLGLSREYNPAMGASLLVGGEYLSKDPADLRLPSSLRETAGKTGFRLQEAELVLSSAVDPSLRADLVLSLASDLDGNFSADLEEAYVTTLSLRGVAIRAGKFHLPFGRHNPLHTHAYPFIDAPLPNVLMLGPEGLNSVAAEAAILIPLDWFVELTLDVADGHNDTLFRSNRFGGLAYGGRLRTLFELGDETTLELGASYFGGKNYTDGWSHVMGGYVNVHWRPAGRELYRQIIWQAEYIGLLRTGPRAVLPMPCGDNPLCSAPDSALVAQAEVPSGVGGLYTYLAAQVAQQWWVEARYEAVGLPRGEAVQSADPAFVNPLAKRQQRVTALGAFAPTEFTLVRLQYSYQPEQDAHQVLLQLAVTIGAHPAHAY